MEPGELQDRIRACTNCGLHKQCEGPVPFRGPVPARYTIVGEAPGSKEDAAGRPFIGPAGQLLDQYLTKVGLDMDDAFICNTVSCFPHGAPQQKHIEACAQNLRDQLVLALAPYILVLGAVALSVFRPEASIMRDHGQHWTVTQDGLSLTCFPAYHPAAVLRNRGLKRAWRLDLEEFAGLVEGGDRLAALGIRRRQVRRVER